MKSKNIDKDLERITISVRLPRYLKVFCDKNGVKISEILEQSVIEKYIYQILKSKKEAIK